MNTRRTGRIAIIPCHVEKRGSESETQTARTDLASQSELRHATSQVIVTFHGQDRQLALEFQSEQRDI